VRDERHDGDHDDRQHRHLPGAVEQEGQRADEDEHAAGDVGERLDDEQLHLFDVAGHPPEHVAGPPSVVEREGEALEVRIERHPHGVAEPPAPAREEDLGEGVAEAVEGGERDEGRRQQCRRADMRRGDPGEPQIGTISLQVVDEIADGVRPEDRGDGLDHEHHERQDEPPAVALGEPEQEPDGATLAAASVCLRGRG
jgi:hypothetical protein